MIDRITKALREEPEVRLSDDFNLRVLEKIRKRERAIFMRNALVMVGSVILFMGVNLVVVISVAGPEFLRQFTSVSNWMLTILPVILLIQFFDWALLKRKTRRYSLLP